jgi:protein-tyrosine-phosphatase
MKTILFVCTGNICRSPMAEGLFRYSMKARNDYRVFSAGVGAIDGQAPSTHAVRALRDLGIDISNQRSRALTPELVEQADFIFGMTHSHVDTVMLLYPHAAEKTFLLREFDETLDTLRVRAGHVVYPPSLCCSGVGMYPSAPFANSIFIVGWSGLRAFNLSPVSA